MILRLDSEKLAETLIFGKNGHFLPKKGPKRVQNFDVRILNSFFHKQTINIVHITKFDHTTSTYWKKLAKNLWKHHFVTPCNVFLTQKGQKRPKRDFSGNFHWVISYIDPKLSLNMEKLRRSYE